MAVCGSSLPAREIQMELFPLRHYFLIYVDQALNGYPMIYAWVNYVALLIFMMLPFLDGYHEDKQHQYARCKGVAQIYGVVQPRVIEWMRIYDDGLEEGHRLFLGSSFGI